MSDPIIWNGHSLSILIGKTTVNIHLSIFMVDYLSISARPKYCKKTKINKIVILKTLNNTLEERDLFLLGKLELHRINEIFTQSKPFLFCMPIE